MSLFAYLIEKLQATPDGDGSLLDHTLYLLGSGMGNPDIHDHTNLPIVIAGGRELVSRAADTFVTRSPRRWPIST